MIDRKALHRLTYGMYVIGAKHGDKINGQVSNTVFQVTSEPPMVSISINKENTTHDMISASRDFTVSVLDVTAPLTLISVFGFKHGREEDKFQGLSHRISGNGAPVLLEHSNAYLEVKVVSSLDLGTHTLFLGEVTDTGLLDGGESMTYEYYHRVLKGVTPKAAPTYMASRFEVRA